MVYGGMARCLPYLASGLDEVEVPLGLNKAEQDDLHGKQHACTPAIRSSPIQASLAAMPAYAGLTTDGYCHPQHVSRLNADKL